MQPETEQRPHKVSFFVEKDKAQAVTKALAEALKKHGVRFVFTPNLVNLFSDFLFLGTRDIPCRYHS